MAHALCVLDKKGYKHTLGVCNTCCFSTAKIGFANAPQYYVYKLIASLVHDYPPSAAA